MQSRSCAAKQTRLSAWLSWYPCLKARNYTNAIISGRFTGKVKEFQLSKLNTVIANTLTRLSLSSPPTSDPPPPEIELWKFDQGLNLKSSRLSPCFSCNLHDGEQGNEGDVYCVDKRNRGRMVLFSLSTPSSWLSLAWTQAGETCSPPTHTSERWPVYHFVAADYCDPHGFENCT